MKAASSIGKEWYQQIESLEKWLEGKKVNTIIGGAAAKLGRMLGDNSDMGYTDQYGSYNPGTVGDMTRGATNSTGSMANSGVTVGSSSMNPSSGNIVGDVISGTYDYDLGAWEHEYVITDLYEKSMTWTAKDDASYVQEFVRVDAVPAEIVEAVRK